MNAYRQSPFANITPVVKNLLIINVIFYIASLVLGDKVDLASSLAIFYFNSPFFRPWQLITYMFMHGGFTHIFFNMFALFMFGPILEYSLGSKKFFNLYFICGIGAIVLQMIVQAVEVHALIGSITLPHPELQESYERFGEAGAKLLEIYRTPVVGASGAIFGLLVAFGMLYPNMELFIFFIPIPIKAKYMVPVYIVIELWLGVAQYGGDNVAHFAHLGGALFGFIVIRLWGIRRPNNFF